MPAKVYGIAELRATLKQLRSRSEVDAIAFRATHGAAKDLARRASANVWAQGLLETGALSRAIAFKKFRKTATLLGYTVGVRHGKRITKSQRNLKDDPWYWWMHEFGTVNLPARPFLRPAFAALRLACEHVIIANGTRAVIKSADAAARARARKVAKGLL